MRLHGFAEAVETFGEVATGSAYTIKPTAKAFAVLTSKLYKDRIAAVIREVSCNAYDAHIEAGIRDRPIEVHLPSELEPYFSVRDFGRGMTPQQMEEVYKTFFESTKEDSNDYIGALGLGGKAPFSMVDSFPVTVFQNGKRIVYECYKDRGEPNLVARSTTTSNEEDGVEVRVAVAPKDITAYADRAARIFRWFDVRPVVSGMKIFIPSRARLRGADWGVEDGYSVVMGQIQYPVSRELVPNALPNTVLFMDIGSLDVQAGREELSYDSETIAALTRRYDAVSAEIDGLYSDLLKDCRDIFTAQQIIGLRGGALVKVKRPSFNGVKIQFTIAETLKAFGTVKPFGSPIDKADLFLYVATSDKKASVTRRFKAWRTAGENAKLHGYMVSKTLLAPEEIIKQAGDVAHIVENQVKAPSRKAMVRRLRESGDINGMREAVIDPDEGGVYLMTRNLFAVGARPEVDQMRTQDFSSLQTLLCREIDQPIYLWPWTLKREVDIRDNWVNAYDLVTERYQEKMSDEAFKKGLREAAYYDYFRAKVAHGDLSKIPFAKLTDHLNRLSRSSTMRDFGHAYKRYHEAYQKYRVWLAYEYNFFPPVVGRNAKLFSLWEKASEEFPLVSHVYQERDQHRVNDIVAHEVLSYIHMKALTKASK